MGTIKSTYRFIPVNENDEYFSPDKWKNDVSMDKPFENALSGTIKYTLTANTAIFVKGSDGNFCNYDGHYFIPGTSVKGCIRSVLEILSFGHLGENRVKNNDERYEFRDIADQQGYMQKMKPIYCGWLSEDGTKIVNWGKPCNIKYYETREERRWDCQKKKNVTKIIILPDEKGEYLVSKINNIANMNCFRKYNSLNNQLEYNTFTNPQRLPNAGRHDQRLFCKFGGTNTGTLFFSGAIDTKKSDFVLLDKDIKRSEIPVPSEVLKGFQKIYNNWSNIPINNPKGGRPVFFTMNGNKVVSIGLSYLHKYYVRNKIRDAVPVGLRGNQGLDLADLMFGNTDDYRGRIQFGPAKGDMSTCKLLMNDDESLLAVLGSPRASYYPTYLQDRKTWDSENPVISGIKRYPIKPTYDVGRLELQGADLVHFKEKFGNDFSQMFQFTDAKLPEKETDRQNGIYNFETVAILKPLKEGAVFNGYIHFFNLKKEELGALLSALTFHGREDICKHSLGMAKSAGYGSASIELTQLVVNDEDKLDNRKVYLDAFETLMTTWKNDWSNTPRLKELFAMAEGFSEKSMAYDFKSMVLKEFAKAKQLYMKPDKNNKGCFCNDFLSYTETLKKSNVRPGVGVQKEKAEPQKVATEIAQAKVTVLSGPIKQAALLEGKNAKQSKPLEVDKQKLKIGDLIEVKVIRKGGNVEKFVLVKKL